MNRCTYREPIPAEVRAAADLLERRWLLSILFAAHAGAIRFNEFKQALGSIPPRTLATRLGELEEAGILERLIYDTRPPSVEYQLTDYGKRLSFVVDALRQLAHESRTVQA